MTDINYYGAIESQEPKDLKKPKKQTESED